MSNELSSGSADNNERTLLEYAYRILALTQSPGDKALLTLRAWNRLQHAEISLGIAGIDCCNVEDNMIMRAPDSPARLADVQVLEPHEMSDLQAKPVIRLIHALCHIELNAINIAWDAVLRFAVPGKHTHGIAMPRQFFVDFAKVAADEAMHFRIWCMRLKELGSYYGALPVHDSLWLSAANTAESLLGRLAVVHCVLEARGLDTAVRDLHKFKSARDQRSYDLMSRIEHDEVTHVAAGIRWFKFVCETLHVDSVVKFHEMVLCFFHGRILPPFNTKMRITAGLLPEYYLPLVDITAERYRQQHSFVNRQLPEASSDAF